MWLTLTPHQGCVGRTAFTSSMYDGIYNKTIIALPPPQQLKNCSSYSHVTVITYSTGEDDCF